MSPHILPMQAVGDATYALFITDETLAGLATGGVFSDVPPSPEFPFLWFELLHGANYGGLGTKPGSGSVPGLTLRLHVFQSDYGTMRDAQIVMARAIELLFTTPLVVEGYTVCSGIPLPEIETIPLPSELLSGVVVKELVTSVELICEEVAA